MTLLALARKYRDVGGLSVIPIKPDGSKAPRGPWKKFQTRFATDLELDAGFADGNSGIAIICGAVSGDVTGIDCEAEAQIKEFGARIREQLGDELANSLVVVVTPSGGHHIYFRCSGWTQGNQKLAQSVDADGKPKVTIETRGTGGYLVAPGSPPECHPSGKLYRTVKGSLLKIPEITPEQAETLFACARSFNEYFRDEPFQEPSDRSTSPEGSLRPGDDYNERGPGWREILESHGWKLLYERAGTGYWVRPGKDTREGQSSTTNHAGSDLLYVFSSKAHPFEND